MGGERERRETTGYEPFQRESVRKGGMRLARRSVGCEGKEERRSTPPPLKEQVKRLSDFGLFCFNLMGGIVELKLEHNGRSYVWLEPSWYPRQVIRRIFNFLYHLCVKSILTRRHVQKWWKIELVGCGVMRVLYHEILSAAKSCVEKSHMVSRLHSALAQKQGIVCQALCGGVVACRREWFGFEGSGVEVSRIRVSV